MTDANDNAPVFVNAPYVLNISEVISSFGFRQNRTLRAIFYQYVFLGRSVCLVQVTVVGTRVLQGIKAVDADQLGPFSTVQYSVLPGPHSVSEIRSLRD